eukprot:6123620-Pleurochrysis_carterae.AAC.1
MLPLLGLGGVDGSARRHHTPPKSRVGRWTISLAQDVIRIRTEVQDDMDRNWAQRPTKALGRTPPRLQKAVDRI